MLLSVIIPVYNVAPYLCACLDSVLAQTCADFELLLVDDGSTDGSGDLCDDYACRDARVTVIHQANAGAAAARNAALDVAQGEYVAFIDADDVVHHAYLELMLCYLHATPDADIDRAASNANISQVAPDADIERAASDTNINQVAPDADIERAASRPDIVQAPCLIVDERQRPAYDAARLSAPLPSRIHERWLTADEALLDMLYQRKGSADSAIPKVIRRSLLDGLRFPTAFRVYEDLYFMAQLYPRVRRMVCLDAPVYYYFKQSSGTLNSLSIRRRDAFDVLQTLEAQYLVTGRRALVRAVRERRLAVALNILRLLAAQPHTEANIVMAHLCWQHIRALRPESIRDPRARLKNRLASLVSYLIYR